MQNNTHKGIVGFVIKYKISLILILILILLVRQNILVNDFPNVIFQKQKIIEDNDFRNKQLQKENKQQNKPKKLEKKPYLTLEIQEKQVQNI